MTPDKRMRWLLMVIAGFLVAACASIGNPEGGPRDELPPEFVRSVPVPGDTNVDRPRLELFFNENVKLEDIANKLVVSPAQSQNPAVNANGKKVTIELRDSLLPNTTYTIDFSDAIRDLNEGNILDGFATDFSTGPLIDTLRLSGMVFEARTLEPAQGMVVGVYADSVFADTTLTKVPFQRVAKTNQLGEFSIRNLKPGTYRIFAIDDKNHDWRWDISENIAFASTTVVPGVETVTVADTLMGADKSDSIVTRLAPHYFPDDILLTWFNHGNQRQYLREAERTDDRRVTLKFGMKADSLPVLTILTGPYEGRNLADFSVLETRQERDSLVYWLTDTVLVKADSLRVAARYLATDTLNQLSWTTDTLKLFLKSAQKNKAAREAAAKEKERLRQEKEREKAEKERLKQEKKAAKKNRKKGAPQVAPADSAAISPDSVGLRPPVAPSDSLPPDSVAADSVAAVKIELLQWKAVTSSQHDINKPLIFESPTPVARIDSAGWRLEVAVDSLWNIVEGVHLVQDSAMVRRYNIEYPWQEETKYRFTADSMAIEDVYGLYIKDFTHEFTVKSAEEYGNIFMHVTDMDQLPDSALLQVELLSKSDMPMVTVTAAPDGLAEFRYIEPGTYFVRAYIDANANGLWDAGSLADSLQPEDVFYFPKKLTLRKNWDIDQDWAMFETPVDLQKPLEVKKNKPKEQPGARKKKPGEDDEEGEEEDEYNDGNWGNGSQYNNAKRGSSNRGGMSTGGLQQVRNR